MKPLVHTEGEVPTEKYRDISVKTLKKFNTKKANVAERNNALAIVYDYGNTSQKFRFAGKDFGWYNHPKSGVTLYGADKFPPGGRRVTITEGENDAMAVYEMMGDYPVVSLKDGASTANKLTSADFDYLNSFDEVIVSFDNDKPGKDAVEKFCAIFPHKTKVVSLPPEFKDAHHMLNLGERDKYRDRWWKAGPWSPSNIVYPIDILDSIVTPKNFDIIPWPWDGLNKQIKGLHAPELITISAPPKVGKSLITAAIVNHIHETTTESVADITVENTPDERNRTLLSFKIRKPLHLALAGEDIGITQDELMEKARSYFEDRRIVSFERDGITHVDQIMEKINFMVTVLGCKYVVFDHINYTTSYHESDERKALDSVSNKLADMAKDKRICLIVVSHENDEGKLFGSRNLVKASHTVIRLERDKAHKDPFVRNLTKLRVTDSRRYGSRIGPPVYLKFNEQTYSFSEEDTDFIENEILTGANREADELTDNREVKK